MVIPPFAPPPYVDSPAYILPHPHIQPVDYRRFLHPQVPAPSAPYQNPNPLRRIRLPQAAPVRETASSAVQTEPSQRNLGRYPDGSPPIRSDSGHGTTSDSPASSSSSSQKQAPESCSLTSNRAKAVQSHQTGKKDTDRHGEDVLAPHPISLDVPSCIRTVERQMCQEASADQETAPPYKTTPCNIWSVGSPDGMVPVCSSSQQEDEVIKERCVSFPDILMSWGGGTPKETIQNIPDKVFGRDENKPLSCKTVKEQDKSVCKSPSATSCSVALGNSDADDSENVLCSQKCMMEPRGNEPLEVSDSGRRPFPDTDPLHSLNVCPELEKDRIVLSEEPTEKISHQMLLGSSRTKGNMNESVWSVESLPPYVPSKELIIQKTNVDSEVILEMTEETENDKEATKCDHMGDESSKKRLDLSRISPSVSVPASTSWLDFATPAQRAAGLSKKPEKGAEPAEPQPDHVLSPAEKNVVEPLTPPRCDATPAAEVEQNRSSEPEANQSPNQEATVKNTGQEQSKRASPESVVGEVALQNEADPENVTSGSDEWDLMSEQTTVGDASPSIGHMVDCGIQCTSLLSYPQDKPLRFAFKHPGKITLLHVFQLQSFITSD